MNKLVNFKDSFSYQIAQFINETKDLITVARVKDIILTEQQSLQGGWNELGFIVCDFITPNGLTLKTNIQAKPLSSNIKKYPLVNELVYIIKLPNTALNQSKTAFQYYYIDTIAVWNHPHHNGFPENPNQLPPEQRKDYEMAIAGSPRRVLDKGTDVYLGSTFDEKPDIHPLLPFEGDFIIEGRWGNSLRLGSTIPNPTGSGFTFPQNNTTGKPGDPITILRNGQSPLASNQGWIPIVEDINNDPSSIYLTTSQQLPLTVGSNIRSTYTKGSAFKETNQYAGPQVAINSSRIVVNANNLDGTILLNGSNTIALQAEKSINLFTKTDIVLDGNVRLGGASATEPVILGATMVNNLTELISNIREFAKVVEEATYQVYNDKTKQYEARPLLGEQRAATQLRLYLDDFEKALPSTLSKRSFTV